MKNIGIHTVNNFVNTAVCEIEDVLQIRLTSHNLRCTKSINSVRFDFISERSLNIKHARKYLIFITEKILKFLDKKTMQLYTAPKFYKRIEISLILTGIPLSCSATEILQAVSMGNGIISYYSTFLSPPYGKTLLKEMYEDALHTTKNVIN